MTALRRISLVRKKFALRSLNQLELYVITVGVGKDAEPRLSTSHRLRPLYGHTIFNGVIASLLSLAMLVGPSLPVSGGCGNRTCCRSSHGVTDGCPVCAAKRNRGSTCCERSAAPASSCCDKKTATTQRTCCRAKTTETTAACCQARTLAVPADGQADRLPCQCRPSPNDLPNPMRQRLVRPPAPESALLVHTEATQTAAAAATVRRTVSQDQLAASPALWVLNCALLC